MLSVAKSMFSVGQAQLDVNRSAPDGQAEIWAIKIAPSADLDTPNWGSIWNWFVEAFSDMLTLTDYAGFETLAGLDAEEIEVDYGGVANVLILLATSREKVEAGAKAFCQYVIDFEVDAVLARVAMTLDELITMG